LLQHLNASPTRSQAVNRPLGITDACSEVEKRSMGNESDKPDFSDARSEVRAQAAQMPPAAKADFSDVHSHVSSSVDQTKIYAVEAGDNLSKIARQFYGDANAWQRIFDANRDQLTDPDRIKVGQMLKIPAKS
jgi:nucleoid-associated protein YgaU